MEGVPADRLKTTTKLQIIVALVGGYTYAFGFAPSMLLGLLGLISVIASSMELLNLFLVTNTVSLILDIIRLATTPKPHPNFFGFTVFLFVMLMLCKLAGSYFAYVVKRSSVQ